MFPTGSPGLGLLLLRVSASAALDAIIPFTDSRIAVGFLIVLSVLLLAGLYLRIASGIAIVIAAYVYSRVGGQIGISVAIHGLTAAALSVLGAGGYSVDARLFGRRVIALDR